MTIFQIGAALFSLFMHYVIFLHYKRRSVSLIEAAFWHSLWLLFIIVALFPNLLLGITQLMRFQRVFDLLVVGGMMMLSVVVFLTYFNQKRTNARFENVIRKIAIDQKQPDTTEKSK